MHYAKGKKEITKKVYVDEKDKENLHYLIEQNINVYIEDVPGERKIHIDF